MNESKWEGMTPCVLDVGDLHPTWSTLVCRVCKQPPSCIAKCAVKAYYILGNRRMTRAFVYLGVHEHPVKDGELRDLQDRTRVLISEQTKRTPTATNSSNVLEATKELLEEPLLNQDGVHPKPLDFDDLVPVLDKCKYFSSLSIFVTRLHRSNA